MATKPIPEGYHSVTPYLAVEGAERAIDYYKKAFGAKERVRMDGPEGTIGHAELEIGDALVMLSDALPQFTTKTPTELGGTSVSIFLYVEDVDATVQRAIDEGGTVTMEVADQFWGDRFGAVTDPFGHLWTIATHVEDSRRRRSRSAPRRPWRRWRTEALRARRGVRRRARSCPAQPDESSRLLGDGRAGGAPPRRAAGTSTRSRRGASQGGRLRRQSD